MTNPIIQSIEGILPGHSLECAGDRHNRHIGERELSFVVRDNVRNNLVSSFKVTAKPLYGKDESPLSLMGVDIPVDSLLANTIRKKKILVYLATDSTNTKFRGSWVENW